MMSFQETGALEATCRQGTAERGVSELRSSVKSEHCCFEDVSHEIVSYKVEQKLFSDCELLRGFRPVECTSLEGLIWWSQVKQSFSACARRIANFQDSEVDAPVSHEFVQSLVAQGPITLLGVRDWPFSEASEGTVRLHIECVAAGTRNADPAANRMRHKLMRILVKEFNKSCLPGPAMAGRNLRDDKEAKMPLNLDNRSALHIALLDESDGSVIGGAVVYIHGPAFGYLPFIAILPERRGQGLGSKFARAIVGVLRHLSVCALILEATVEPATRDQRIIRFWENHVGFVRATDEFFDNQEKLTNTSRNSRISGCAIREMSGVYAFPDGCIMFRGTKQGWKLGDSDVALPVVLHEAAVSCSISAVHDKYPKDSQTSRTRKYNDVGIGSPPGGFSGELSTWPQVPRGGPTLDQTSSDTMNISHSSDEDPYSTQSSMDSNDKRGVFTAEDHDGSEESCFLHVEATTAPIFPTVGALKSNESAKTSQVLIHARSEHNCIGCEQLKALPHTAASVKANQLARSIPEVTQCGKRHWMLRAWNHFVRARTCRCLSAPCSEAATK